jgi:hypothetical protein
MAVEVGGIDTEWCTTRMSYGGATRKRESTIHQRGRGAGVAARKERDGAIMMTEMIAGIEVVEEIGEEETEGEGIEIAMMIEIVIEDVR